MEALSGLDMEFADGHSSDDDDLIAQDALLRDGAGLPSFEASFRPPPTPRAPDLKGKGRPASSLASSSHPSSGTSTLGRRTAASTPATDEAGVTTFAKKPSAFQTGGGYDNSVAADYSGLAAGGRAADSSSAVLANLDLSTPNEDEQLEALDHDPAFASPPPSPPPPGRRRPSANGNGRATLPKPGRAVSASSTDAGGGAGSVATAPTLARTKSSKNNLTLREQEKVPSGSSVPTYPPHRGRRSSTT
jgi:hypothetical protein